MGESSFVNFLRCQKLTSPNTEGSESFKDLMTKVESFMSSGVIHILGSGTITHCMLAAMAALTTLGRSSKTRQFSGVAAGSILNQKLNNDMFESKFLRLVEKSMMQNHGRMLFRQFLEMSKIGQSKYRDDQNHSKTC